ncbi:uncharacterized protein F4812DRAFT_81775 [Daldinia caldariorum]|uniref:uncharacterized protein n=1 Tax=Daldinia caldariorum TaxID=326644 RepID=UPI002007BF75|nr:uncharacterized protein F4812DRAFT_81775 [Daldinia caldariorum]KAI1466522.1 hypothetical protein F4812DRAFT_81775 [Daldinia caldariorum]
MGNSISAEAPWRGHRTSQKLSKPKIGNPTAAGLLNTNGDSNSACHSSAARRTSLPQAPILAAPPSLPEKDPVVSVSVPSSEKGLDLGHRISRRLFRSNTSKETPRHQRRSNCVEVSDLSQERWATRAGSQGDGFERGYNYSQPPVPVSLSMSTSRTSFNYDPFSYEAQRLSNLVSEPSREDSSLALENRTHVYEAMRGDVWGRRPSIPEVTPSITHSSSDISLYTPMRRRSFMTPGVATREVLVDSTLPKIKSRYSLPSTPARRNSMELMDVGTIEAPPGLAISDPAPRALTPCEAEYTQTGAFKFGTLRITNGSPARSPARSLSPVRDSSGDIRQEEAEELAVNRTTEDYFGTAPTGHSQTRNSETSLPKVEGQNVENSLSPPSSSNTEAVTSACSISSLGSSELTTEHQISLPLFNDGKPNILDVHVTSKHTAMEDKLFDDEPDEYSSVEILDVRIDTNAKSTPPCSKPVLEKGSSREISRSDSGIASPASESSVAPLSKADSGYSSSVSLRSLSSKPSAPKKDRTVEATSDAGVKQSEHAEEPDATILTTATANVKISRLSNEPSPPPVPMKDSHLAALASPKAPSELSPQSQQTSRLTGISQPTGAPERVLSPRNLRSRPSRSIETHQMPSGGLHVSSPSRSITSGFRKPGKLQRFLSGSRGRAPLTVHNTHPTGYTRVPAVPRDMHARLQTHTGSRAISFRKLALRSAASKETLGTILSVGSAELLQDEDFSSKTLGGQIMASDRNQKALVSMESKAAGNLSTLSKSIRRKPVSSQSNDISPESTTAIKTSMENNIAQVVSSQTANRDYNGSTNAMIASENTRCPTYAVQQPISNAMTISREEESRTINSKASYEFAQGKSRSASTLEPPPPVPSSRFSKSPPPVSMRTRNMGSLRVPSPARSKSTPPENMGRPRLPPHSHRGNPEDKLRTPEMSNTFAANRMTASRRSSREKLQMDHDPSLSRRSSDISRRSSLSRQSSQRSAATTGPAFFGQQYHSQPDLPLHRRSSYDEYNILPQNSSARDNGPYPSLSRNGQTYVSNPWSGRSMSLPQQWDQGVQYPPHPPRHHIRHRSLDQYGNPMPYRVLHSYNSPAYRHLPIWR